MTYEECINCLPDELNALGYKIVYGKMIDNITNFYLDDDCHDCLFRIINTDIKSRKCICYAQNIHSRDWKLCYYKDFNDKIYENIMNYAKNMVEQYKKYTIDLKINEISKDF